MKKKVISVFLALAMCLTLLPIPAWAETDAPEGGAPAVSEQTGTNEDENGTEGGQQDTGTPDAGGAEDSKADAPESGGDEDTENHADAAVSAVQTMIDGLPDVDALDGMTADELDAAYDDIQAAYDAYEALTAEQQTEITGADCCFEPLFGWFSSQTAPLADAQSGGHTHCVCDKTHQKIGDHKSADEKTFTAWTETASLPTSGTYYLMDDVTISGNVTLSEDVTLCLNGHTVNISSGGINVVGGTFTLTDCSSNSSGTIQGHGKQGVAIHANNEDDKTANFDTASFVMYGGKLTGFSNAVMVGSMYSLGYSRFTMYGGSITGNYTGSAAAVSGIAKSTHTGDNLPTSFITMYGGEISNNTGEAGGGVYIGDNCTFTLAGGKISNNTATGRDVKDPKYGDSALPIHNGGGGVYLDSWGKFYMTGGEISNNEASGVGGGVCVMTYVTSCYVSITGGKITDNVSTDNSGGGIYGGPAKLTIQNTEISGNKCAYDGGGIYATKPLTLENVQVINNTANTAGGGEGGGVKLGGTEDNFRDAAALTVSESTSISDNSPNNYYADYSYLLPIKVSGTLDANARIGICLNPASATDKKFLPTATSDSVVATAAEGVTLRADNFTADNRDFVVQTDTSSGVKFGLCDHVVREGSNECSQCGTTFAAVFEPKDASAKNEYFRDLSGADFTSKTGTLKLFQDVTFTKSVSIYGSTLTLDLNGHTIKQDSGSINYITLDKYGDTATTLTVIDGTGADTADRTLYVEFTVRAGCALNLYDGTNEQGFRGTVTSVRLTRTGKLVSCGGKIETLWLYRGDTESYAGWRGLKLWEDNDHYCTIGAIKNSETAAGMAVIYVEDLLKKTHPNCTLYGTKDGIKTAVTSKYVQITSAGVGGGYTDLYLQAHEHTPKSDTEMTCQTCNEALVVEITATKGSETKTAYFTKDSSDTTRWDNGQDEAAAQLAAWVNTDGCTDAKLIPHESLEGGTMRLTCKMTLVGTGCEILGGVSVKDGAEVTFDGGTYKDSISVTGTAAFEGGTYYGKITVSSGEAVFESGTFNSVAVNGGTATVKDGATFAATNSFASNSNNAIDVTGGTLNVEGGTIGSKVTVSNNGGLTVSGGKFTNVVTIDYTTRGACTISGGTFTNTVDVRLNTSSDGTCTISGGTFAKLEADSGNLSALLADGYNFYDTSDKVVSGEVDGLTNVTVKGGHTHNPDENGTCACGAQMAASVTVGGETGYYATIEAAVKALNAVDGAKTLKLLQDRKSDSATYTLEKGSVTLDVNGKQLSVATFVAQGITLTLKGTESGGLFYEVQAVGKDSKIIADSTNIEDDGNLTVRTISAKNGGALELSAGTFWNLYVVKDGSSASLAGGTYQPESYEYGKGPDKDTEYVGTVALLAKGYGYQKEQSDGNFVWVTNGRIQRDTNNTYKVAEIGASFEKIYPDDKADFTGDTYLVKLGEDQTTYTLKLTAVGTSTTDRVSYQWQSGKDDGGWTNRPLPGDTNYEADATNGTFTIKNLTPGTYRYRVQYTLKDADGATALTGYSKVLTVVVTKHEHSWTYTAEDATITAKCTADDCYLTGGNGGSVTINAPAADTLTYDGERKPATLAWTDWVDAAKKDAVENNVNSIWYGGSINGTSNLYGSNSAPKEAGTYTASLTIGDATAFSAAYTIGRAKLTMEGTAAATAVYSRNLKVKDITITGLNVTFNGTEVKGTWKFDSSAHPEVGNTTAYQATFKPNSDTYNNYETLTTQITPTITKGTYDGATMGMQKNVLAGEAQTGVEVSLMPNIAAAAIADLKVDDNHSILSNVRHENGKVYFDVKKVSEAGKTATITLTYSSKNYENFTGTITVKTVKKGPANVTITDPPKTVTYGQEFTLKASQTGDTGSAGNPWSWDFDETYFQRISDGINQGKFTLTLQAIKAGTPSKGITVTYESGTYKGSDSVQFSTIAPKELTITDVTAERRDYAPNNTSVTLNGGTLQGVVGTDTVTFQLGTGTITDASAGTDKPVTTTIRLTGSGAENYTLTQPTDIKVTIDKASWTYTKPTGLTAKYGQKLREITLTNPTSNLPGTWTWQELETVLDQIGSQTYYADFEPEDQNYKGVKNAGIGVTVGKADALRLADIAVSQKYTVTTEQSKQIGSIMPADAGTLTYAKGTESTTGAVTVTSWAVDSTTGKVTYTLSGGAAGDTVTLPVKITSTNYEDSTVNVKITLTDKETPTASANDINVTYNGAEVPASAITGTASVEGTWSWKTTAPKNVADSSDSVTVVFTPADTVNYVAVEDTIKVTINKATPTGTPTYTAITTSGKKLSDAALVIDTITPAGGTIKWVNADNSELADTTEVAANTSYKWLYTPADTANYNTLTGSIELWHRSSSGGSGSSVTTYSVTVGKTENGTVSVSPKSAAKGSTVTITVTPDKGYVLETLTALDKDGKELKLTAKDGKYTFTMPAGKVEVKATFMDDNTMLNYFVDVKAGDYFYDAVLWAAQKGITNGINDTEFGPNLSCTRAQIVTFLWRAAGSPEPKGTGSFADVPADSYYAKAVAWAVENGITGGTGDGKFSPDVTCTREQAVAFLYRASGSPAVSGGSAFSDVAANAYYADAVAWAEKNEITGGIGSGLFGSGNDCTRAQIVTFLHRSYLSK